MNAKDVRPSSDLPLATQKRDSAKLVSLVALATGAVAMPQTGNADIIYQPANAHVGFGSGDSISFPLSLPGTVGFGFWRVAGGHPQDANFPSMTWTFTRKVVVGRTYVAQAFVQAAYGLALPRGAGEAWDKNGVTSTSTVAVARATSKTFHSTQTWSSQHRPASDYSNQYLAFRFNNGGSRYGWVKVSLTSGMSPSVTILGYAYDTTGAKLGMGVVPEPSSIGVLALGALTLGANGLRAWRRNRTQS